MLRLFAACLAALLLLPAPARSAPLAEKYLLEGKLAEGEKALTKHLADKPDDDQARMGLAAIQLGRAVEGVTKALYRHGLRSPLLLEMLGLHVKDLKPNPKPEKLTHAGLRKIVQGWVDDLAKVEVTLAKVKSETVKMPLAVGRVKLDLFGNGKSYSALELLGLANRAQAGRNGAGAVEGAKPGARQAQKEKNDEQGLDEYLKKLVIAFDRGDAHWLRGYCHFLSAVGELILALDTKDLFDTTAHLFFTSVESPFPFLAEDFKPLREGGLTNTRTTLDAVSFAYQAANLPIKEPERMKKVLAHLEGMVRHAKEMWKHIQAEKDDDREWIPNPRQKGVLGVPVTKERMEAWLTTLDEVDAIVQGKKLVPFWRGKKAQGFNLRKVFLNPPKSLDLVRWVQGTAAAPYLEKGTITALADPKTIERLDRTFGGLNFFGFAFWFN